MEKQQGKQRHVGGVGGFWSTDGGFSLRHIARWAVRWKVFLWFDFLQEYCQRCSDLKMRFLQGKRRKHKITKVRLGEHIVEGKKERKKSTPWKFNVEIDFGWNSGLWQLFHLQVLIPKNQRGTCQKSRNSILQRMTFLSTKGTGDTKVFYIKTST